MKASSITKPVTIIRLDNIKPGETITYFKGRHSDTSDKDTPFTNALISNIFAHAKKLASVGRIELIENTVKVDKNFAITEYMARGKLLPFQQVKQ